MILAIIEDMLHWLLTGVGKQKRLLWLGALSVVLMSFVPLVHSHSNAVLAQSLKQQSALSVEAQRIAAETAETDIEADIQADIETDTETAHSDILRSLAPLQVVYLAENHDDPADHAAQLAIIQALAAQNEIAIALEMFQRPFQPALDAYLAGEISEAALIAQSEYDSRWGYDWEFYAPILRYAKANQIPLVALNTPTEVTQQVAREGLASLSGDDLMHIPPLADIDLSNAAYRAQIVEAFSAHGEAGHSPNFENFWAAQVLWDETMAERIAQQRLAQPERQVIVLAGEGHIAYGYGIPSRVARRLPAVTQASVVLTSSDQTGDQASIHSTSDSSTPKLADFFWLTDAR